MKPWMWIVAAVLYFVCPVDGDFVFPIGYLDDVAFTYYCWKQWQRQTAELQESGQHGGVEFPQEMNERPAPRRVTHEWIDLQKEDAA